MLFEVALGRTESFLLWIRELVAWKAKPEIGTRLVERVVPVRGALGKWKLV